MEHLDEIVDLRVTWFKSLNAADQAKQQAEKAAFADEVQRKERMDELAATFAAADANQDGVLDMPELQDCMNKMA